ELVPTIVHDLKNPLGALSSVAESAKETLTKLLEREPEGPHVEATAEVAEDLGVMRAQLRRLRDMVQSILNLSRQTEGYEEEFLVTDAAADALEAIALQVKDLPRIEVKRELAGVIPEARGNRGQLSQVMVNLLWNAVQALGEEGGTVVLRARDGNGEIVIDVADSGHGVPPEAREKIFEPFYTTKEASHGTGLGLYLCKQIIERHGGRVEVGESDLGGALFRVVIPAAD
ncbi:MAG: HAMP domain-containing histidine kinase, partial [Chrysiogenetes bacterium]|nr:HAMP domain-containing histidine kinase [Chrysiogenetes bacterium]